MNQLAVLSGHWTLAVSLGVGLLMGIERERSKGTGPARNAAGVRTFALIGLLGGVCASFPGAVVVAVGVGFVGIAAVAAYVRSPRDDPGLTTEVAMVVAFLLGALALDDAPLAAGLAVVVTVILASRSRLHDFVGHVLTERELHDGLIFAAAALVVLPLVPNRPVGPLAVFNPFTVWRLVVLVMAISAVGYVARRVLGPRYGLAIAGLAGGFVSAAATVGTMGTVARRDPPLMRAAAAGALFANIATITLMIVLLAATSPATLREVVVPLIAAGVVALIGGAIAASRVGGTSPDSEPERGRAFDLRGALIFAVTLTAVLLGSAALNDVLGERGLVVATALAGFVDTHSAAVSAAALVATGAVQPDKAALAVMAALSTNTITKVVVARAAGSSRFAWTLTPTLALMIAVMWGVDLVQRWM